jgi:hypothetical protein
MSDRVALILLAWREHHGLSDSYDVSCWLTTSAPYWVIARVCSLLEDWSPSVRSNEHRLWLKNYMLHREFGPAIRHASGKQCWYRDGERHRDKDMPAVIHVNGTREWWRNGKRHRDGDMPAVIYANGTRKWWRDGKRHRDGDLPAAIYIDGTREWWQDGWRHRDGDLPAVMNANGTQEWYNYGQQHRGNDD